MEQYAARAAKRHGVYKWGAASDSRLPFGPELLFDQRLGRLAAADAERDRQSQHQRAKGDGERREDDRGGQPHLLEGHHHADGDDQHPQRAAQQAGAGQAGVHRRQQRGAPEKIADQETDREHQQRDEEARNEPEELLDQSLKRRQLQRVHRRHDESEPDDPEDDLRDQHFRGRHLGHPQHLARAAAQRQAIEVHPREEALNRPADDQRDHESAGEDDRRGDESRHEQHERRGEVAPRLDERIGDFLNHRDLTFRPTSWRRAPVSIVGTRRTAHRAGPVPRPVVRAPFPP